MPYARLFIIALTIVCVAEFTYSCNVSPGVADRSVTEPQCMSACLGIPTQKVDALVALGSGLAGVAGVQLVFSDRWDQIPVKTILWIRSWL